MNTMTFLKKALLVFGIFFSYCATSQSEEKEPQPLTGTAYVTSWFGSVVTAIDLSTGTTRKTIPVGIHDHNIALRPDQKQAWVTNNNSDNVSVIDTETNTVIGTLSTGNGPRHTYFTPDGREAYVTNEFDDQVEVFDPGDLDTSLGTIKVGLMPHFALVSGDQVYVTNFGGGDVTVLSRSQRKILATVPVGFGPLGAGATKDGKRIYVACHGANHVTVIDGETHKAIANIPTNTGPVQITVTPSQTHAYVANDGSGTVQKIELATNQVVKTILIAPDAGSHGIGFSGNGRWLLITNTGASTISVIDTETDTLVKTYPVPKAPEGIAVKH